MRTKFYIFFIVIGLSIFTYSSDSQDGPGVGAYTSYPGPVSSELVPKKFPKENSIYCDTKGTSIAYGWIDEVVVGQYEFVSGSNSGYADLTNREFDIQCGAFNTFNIKSGQSNSANKHNWRVWIDYNKDGIYDNDEQVISNFSVHMKGMVYIPARSKITYRTGMRIAMNRDDIPNACGNFKYGEVEDYTVVLKIPESEFTSTGQEASTLLKQRISSYKVSVFPNPAKVSESITLDFNADESGEMKITLFNIDGRLVKTETQKVKVGNNLLNIEGMITENGVYLLKMQTEAKSFIKKITVIE